MPQVGFDGNADLYGIGIRIGYYTAALSLWISHLWAPTEIYFLRPITLTFLAAVLIGVSVLSADPANTRAIEPFMMMQIAYYTYYMGAGGPHPLDLLPWEQDYFRYILTVSVGLALHVFDTWYWWHGIKQMIATPGVKTFGLFIYFGQANLFGWVRYAMRTYLGIALACHIWAVITNLFQRRLEHEMNRQVPQARLKELSERWISALDPPVRFTLDDDGLRQRTLLAPPSVSRQPSKTSVKSAPARSLPMNQELNSASYSFDKAGIDIDWSPDDKSNSQYDRMEKGGEKKLVSPAVYTPQLETEAEYQLQRTTTDRIKQHLLGWQPEQTYTSQPRYYYTPTLESLSKATDLLESLNRPYKRKFPITVLFTFHFEVLIAVSRCIPAFLTHRFRPRLLLALLVHMRTLTYTREQLHCTMWRLALRHPAYEGVRAEDIALASRILVTLAPLRKPKKAEMLAWAYVTFSTCAQLVIGTELAIQWNQIQGVQNLKTVGQLIPAAIGFGGLVKVVWSAFFDSYETAELCFGRCRAEKKRLEWADACEVYAMARAAWERRTEAVGDKVKKEMSV